MQQKYFLNLIIGFVFIFQLCIRTNTIGQDTLTTVFSQPSSVPKQIQLYQQLSEQALHANTDLAIQYATKAWQLAHQNKDANGIAKSNIQLAKIYSELKQYKNALDYYEQAKEIYIELADKLNQGKIQMQVAEILQIQKNYEKAEENLGLALSFFREEKNEFWTGKCLMQFGALKNIQNLAQDAALFFEDAIHAFETNPLFTSELIPAYIALGDQQRNLLHYKNALDNYFKALKLSETNLSRKNKQVCITNIGWTFYLQEAYQDALKYCSEGLDHAKELNNSKIIEQNNKCLGAIYLDLKDYEKAIHFLNEALETAKESSSSAEKQEIYKLLSHLYETKGDFKAALKFRKVHQSLNDTLLIENNARQMAEIQSNFNFLVEEKVKDLLHAKRQTVDAKKQLQYYSCLGVSLFLLFFGTIGGLAYRLITQNKAQESKLQNIILQQTQTLRKTNEELHHANEELKRFAYIASHDLKEPLRNIASFTTLIKRKVDQYIDKDTAEYFQFVMNNTQQITALVTDIFEYSKLDNDHITLSYVNINQVIEKAQVPLKKLISDKNAQIECEDLPMVYSNASYIQLIFKNIIENGLKYNESEQAHIKISCQELPDWFEFKFEDNGVGISKDYHEYVFEMFRRLHDRQTAQGSGLGLAICKKVIRRLQGKIDLTSELGKGSTFFVYLPKGVVETSPFPEEPPAKEAFMGDAQTVAMP